MVVIYGNRMQFAVNKPGLRIPAVDSHALEQNAYNLSKHRPFRFRLIISWCNFDPLGALLRIRKCARPFLAGAGAFLPARPVIYTIKTNRAIFKPHLVGCTVTLGAP